jgi:hypothetical protein
MSKIHRKQVEFVENFNEIVWNILPNPQKAVILKRTNRQLINILFCGYWRLEIANPWWCWNLYSSGAQSAPASNECSYCINFMLVYKSSIYVLSVKIIWIVPVVQFALACIYQLNYKYRPCRWQCTQMHAPTWKYFTPWWKCTAISWANL